MYSVYFCAMFYRRKIILALIQLFDGEIEKIRLQKLLFLFTQKQQPKVYDFVPFRFGCYSYSANADLTTMVNKGMLTESAHHFKRLDNIDYLKGIKDDDRRKLVEIKSLYGGMDSDALMKHTYIHFPYWAINSEKAKGILSKSEYENVMKSVNKDNDTVLFTIGYEGISLEEYLNRLVRNNVQVLVDVRNNPLSMKYGFSKSLLKRFCESLGIQYIHFPEVGVQSEHRKELNTQSDYDNLFYDYRRTTLTQTSSSQNAILQLLIENKRIALTCFEANICQCHRKHLAEAIEGLPTFKFAVKHI